MVCAVRTVLGPLAMYGLLPGVLALQAVELDREIIRRWNFQGPSTAYRLAKQAVARGDEQVVGRSCGSVGWTALCSFFEFPKPNGSAIALLSVLQAALGRLRWMMTVVRDSCNHPVARSDLACRMTLRPVIFLRELLEPRGERHEEEIQALRELEEKVRLARRRSGAG